MKTLLTLFLMALLALQTSCAAESELGEAAETTEHKVTDSNWEIGMRILANGALISEIYSISAANDKLKKCKHLNTDTSIKVPGIGEFKTNEDGIVTGGFIKANEADMGCDSNYKGNQCQSLSRADFQTVSCTCIKSAEWIPLINQWISHYRWGNCKPVSNQPAFPSTQSPSH